MKNINAQTNSSWISDRNENENYVGIDIQNTSPSYFYKHGGLMIIYILNQLWPFSLHVGEVCKLSLTFYQGLCTPMMLIVPFIIGIYA